MTCVISGFTEISEVGSSVQKVSKLCPEMPKIDRNGQNLNELQNFISRRKKSGYEEIQTLESSGMNRMLYQLSYPAKINILER